MVNGLAGDEQEDGGDGSIVVVPHAPGPVVRMHRPSRGRDELDDLIDELFPDTDEGPGWFDAGLVAVATGLVGWGLVGGGPTAALVVGGVALVLGAILPVRWAWRRIDRRRHLHRRRALLARGVPLEIRHPATARLVRAYDELTRTTGALASTPDAGTAAAHSAVLEVATLLAGRAPESEDELEYTAARAAAIEGLTLVVRELQDRGRRHTEGSDLVGPDPALVIEARRELDSITGINALTRLDELTAETRRRRAGS